MMKNLFIKMTNDLMLGIEIETNVIGSFDESIIGGYHSGSFDFNGFGNYWKCEEDCSLSGENPVEFISKKLEGKEQFFKAIEDFKHNIIEHTGIRELYSGLDFNDSCGCHIHIGSKNDYFFKKIPFFLLKKMRNRFFRKVRKSQNLSVRTKEKVLNHYFRNYAKKTTKERYYSGGDRGEFNTQSEMNNRGLEWRSFNLYNVESWGEFDEMFRIAWDCISFLHDKLYNGYTSDNYDILKKSDKNMIKDELPKDINTRIILDNNYFDEINNENEVENMELNLSEV